MDVFIIRQKDFYRKTPSLLLNVKLIVVLLK